MSHTNPYLASDQTFGERELIDWFLSYDISHYSSDFQGSGESQAFKLFARSASRIPAYRDFLAQHGWRGKYQVIKHTQWEGIPPMDKQSYIGLHSLDQLVEEASLGRHGKMISLSSGSSGQAFMWPRSTYQEIEGALLHEQLLTTQFAIGSRRTLVVVAFSMGSYLAGTYTYNSIRWVASKGYDLTVVTPGIDMQDGLDLITKLAPLYDQVILAGYPPYIKDMLEVGVSQGINWAGIQVKLLMASEFFSEIWRSGVSELAGISDVTHSTTNIFGASEGTMFGWETPEAIFLKQVATQHPDLHRALFGGDLTPTLVEYNPLHRYFEVIDGSLHVTARTGIPLIRYDLKDRGGILTAQSRRAILHQFGIELPPAILRRASDLPMVYVSGRADSAASIYGILIYPQYIKEALENESHRVSGRFTLVSKSLGEKNPQLVIHVELKKGRKLSSPFASHLEQLITRAILNRSREYGTLLASIGDKARPHVFLHPKNDPDYFSTRIKQKWIDQ